VKAAEIGRDHFYDSVDKVLAQGTDKQIVFVAFGTLTCQAATDGLVAHSLGFIACIVAFL
jgi:hypothetical protein